MISLRALEILKQLQTFSREDLEEIRYGAEVELMELDFKEGKVTNADDFLFDGDE